MKEQSMDISDFKVHKKISFSMFSLNNLNFFLFKRPISLGTENLISVNSGLSWHYLGTVSGFGDEPQWYQAIECWWWTICSLEHMSTKASNDVSSFPLVLIHQSVKVAAGLFFTPSGCIISFPLELTCSFGK